MIKVNNLNKFYHRRKNNEIHVINNVNLEITAPGMTAIVGPSGAGKSTLLHVIGGLDNSDGKVLYDDINLNAISTKKRDAYRNQHIGYIFQNYNLLPELSVYENLKVQMDLIGKFPEEELDKQITDCLKIVGMEKYKRRNVMSLSGGQQQRVAIARAIVKGADVLIADEPTGNLDSKNSIEIMNILKILSKKCLVLIVTHDLNLAKYYANRIIKISDGHVIDDQLNKAHDTLLSSQANAIYLDDFDKKSVDDSITIYSNGDSKISLNLIIDNNTIYIQNQSQYSLKVIGENTDKLVLENKPVEEKITEETALDIDYAQPQKLKGKEKLSNLCKNIKHTVFSFLNSSKRIKLLYFSFFLIGMILCLCLSSLSLSTIIDQEILADEPVNAIRVNVSGGSSSAKYGYSIDTTELLQILDEESSISGIVDFVNKPSFSYKVISNRSITIDINNKCYISPTKTFNYDYELVNNEVIISDKIADTLINYLNNFGYTNYDSLKNLTLNVSFPSYYAGEIVIKDVIDLNNYTFLVSDKIYFSTVTTSLPGSAINYRVITDTDIILDTPDELNQRGLQPVYVSKKLYPYLIRKVITTDSTGHQTYYFETSSPYYDILGVLDDDQYDVVFMSHYNYSKFLDNLFDPSTAMVMPSSDNLELETGKLPENNFEILLPYIPAMYNKFRIGSTYQLNAFMTRCTVVGFYKVSYPDNFNYIYSNYQTAYMSKIRSQYSKITQSNNKILEVYSSDNLQTINYFNALGYEANQVSEMILRESLLHQIDASKIAIIVSISIIIVMVIFIFFINRSKMIHNIYNIGVQRALGTKKSKIYQSYIIDSLVLSTFTVVLGFVLMYLFTINVNDFISGIAINFGIFILTVGLIYVIMLLASLLPIFLLLRKTPIEIINKYDI